MKKIVGLIAVFLVVIVASVLFWFQSKINDEISNKIAELNNNGFIVKHEQSTNYIKTTGKGDIEVIGNTSLHNLNDIDLLTIPAFKEKWKIDLSQKTILVTFQPETVHFENAANNAETVSEVLTHLLNDYQIIITMPNADTNSSVYREMFNLLADKYPTNVFLIENFGTQSYFSCMQHATFLLGNTSSGIVEAASFKKYVINVGDRQKGRFMPDNILNVPFENESILNAVRTIADKQYEGENPFYIKNSMELILNSLKRG